MIRTEETMKILAAAIALAWFCPARAQDKSFDLALPGLAQDKSEALIEKLKSGDKDEAENAKAALLAIGEPALAALQAAASRAPDGDLKKLLTSLSERLETRKGAAGLAKSWGDRWYSIYFKDLHAGWAHLKIEEVEGGFLLVDELYAKRGDQEAVVKVSVTSRRNEYLSPIEISLDARTGEYTGKVDAKVKDGRIIALDGGDKKATRVPPNLITDFSVMRLVTVLPRSAGYDLTVLQTTKPKLFENAVLRFEKEESIDYEGKKVKVRRYALVDGENDDKVYWVDAQGRLLRFTIGAEAEGVLSDEKKAKDLD